MQPPITNLAYRPPYRRDRREVARHHGWEDLVNHAGSKVLQFRCVDKCGGVRINLHGAGLVVSLHVAVLIYHSEADCRVSKLLSRTRYSRTASGFQGQDKRWEEFMYGVGILPVEKGPLPLHHITDENISRRFC